MGNGEQRPGNPLGSPYLQINLDMLARRQPELAAQLSDLAADPAAVANTGAKVSPARSGALTVSYGDEGYIHSRRDPHREAAAWANGVEPKGTVLVVFGFGLGYHVEHLLQRSGIGRIVVIERDLGRLLVAVTSRNLGQILATGRVRFFYGNDVRELLSQQSGTLLGSAYKGGWTYAPLPTYRRLFPGQAADIEKQLILQARAFRTDIATNERWSTIWIRNVMANLTFLSRKPYVDDLFPHGRGGPALLVAAGPSLTANLASLTRLKGHVPLIAAGSSFNPLLDYGLEPDLIVSFDAGKANYLHFAGRQINVPLAFGPVIYPQILQEYHGPLVPMPMTGDGLSGYLLKTAGHQAEPTPMGPSVANSTLALMATMGFDPIILVGQDLAFPDDQYHAEGVRGAQWTSETQRRSYIWVPAVDGGQVQTDAPFYTMLTWFENYLVQQPHLKVINTSRRGARIAGTTEAPLDTVIDTYGLANRTWAYDSFRSSDDQCDHVNLAATWDVIMAEYLPPVARIAEKGCQHAELGHKSMALGPAHPNVKQGVVALRECQQEMQALAIYNDMLQPILQYGAIALDVPVPRGQALAEWFLAMQRFYQRLLSLVEYLRAQRPPTPGQAPAEQFKAV